MPPIPHTKDSGVVTRQQLDELCARQPIMPKQLRSTKKGEKKAQSSIKIARPEMTLEGFQHLKSNLRKKELLNAGIEARRPGEVDVVSKSALSKSSRKSARHSLSPSKQLGGLDDEPDASDDTDYRDIEQPPMNEEIEPSLDEKSSQQHPDDTLLQRGEVYKKFGPGVPTAALDPKNYAFVPSQWTRRIREAGRQTH